MVPLNLLRNSKKADYVVTGTWAKKAYKEATKFGDIAQGIVDGIQRYRSGM